MAIPARGVKDIRTHLGHNPGQREAYQLFMEISGLEMERARRIIEAHAVAEAEGKGVVVVDGRLVESLHVAEARRVVALSAAIAARRG